MQKKILPVCLIALIFALTILPASVAAKPPAYVSIGTSLAAGHTEHPNKPGSCQIKVKTPLSYTDKIAEFTGLKHKKLGCSGETIETFLYGTDSNGFVTNCDYEAGSQFNAILEYIGSHGDDIRLITIDLGANDVLPCFELSPENIETCLYDQIGYVFVELTEIITSLRETFPPGVEIPPIIGMTYYNPLLVIPDPSTGMPPNPMVEEAIEAFNFALEMAYTLGGAYVAFVDEWFHTYVPGMNLYMICENTLMCECSDIHPNDSGYELITEAFMDVIMTEGILD